PGKVDDRIEMPVDLALLHTKDRAIQVTVFPARQCVMKSGSDFQQRGDTASYLDRTRCWVRYPGKYLEQSAFAGSIAPDDADHLPFVDVKRDIAQCPDSVTFRRAAIEGLPYKLNELLPQHQVVLQL